MTVYCGIDWAAQHHDVVIVNDAGRVLATQPIPPDRRVVIDGTIGGRGRGRRIPRLVPVPELHVFARLALVVPNTGTCPKNAGGQPTPQ